MYYNSNDCLKRFYHRNQNRQSSLIPKKEAWSMNNEGLCEKKNIFLIGITMKIKPHQESKLQRAISMFVITRRKFYVTLKRDILQSSCQKIPVMEFVFNEIAGIDCRPETEKELPTRGFFVDASGFLTLLQSSLT